MQVIKFYKKLLVILLSIILLSGCSNDEILLSDIVPLDLNDKLDSKLINKDYDVELYQSKGNLITGSILNLNGHPIIFKTDPTLYNISFDNSKFFNGPVDTSILSDKNISPATCTICPIFSSIVISFNA